MALDQADYWAEDAIEIVKEEKPQIIRKPSVSTKENSDKPMSYKELQETYGISIYSFRATTGDGHNEFEFSPSSREENRAHGRLRVSDNPQYKNRKVEIMARRLEGKSIYIYMRVEFADRSVKILDSEKTSGIVDPANKGHIEYCVL